CLLDRSDRTITVHNIIPKVRFPHLSSPYRTVIVVSSSPFGLVTNTSQATDLFAEVFIKELQMLNQPP
ncbi:unnamed protein product, partial [Adineta steineri]